MYMAPESPLPRQAGYDRLTGLPGRSLFIKRLEMVLERNRRRQEGYFAVLLIDLDRFRWINDTHGHLAGDQVLKTVASRLTQGARIGDTVARVGDDEFVLLLDDVCGHWDVLAERRRIHERFTEPYLLANGPIKLGASMGCILSTNPHVSSQELFRDVSIALFQAKKLGGGRYKIFTNNMRDNFGDDHRLETELREALVREEFLFHYQPIMDVETLKLTGFEALIRWQHPSGTLVFPDRFIPMAETNDLIKPIGRWSITQACRQLRYWNERYANSPGISLNVNVAPAQFNDSGLIKYIARAIAEAEIPPESLKIEITETLLMQDIRLSADSMLRLKRLGVSVGIDDFGTGYSSLAYLRDLPIDFLKIDKSFISGHSRRSSEQIVQLIFEVAQKLKVDVVAEGVEDMIQLQRLRDLRCQSAQGYLFAKPEPVMLAGKRIEAHSPPPMN